MALPAKVHEQIAQIERHLSAVPAGEQPPSKAMRTRVQRWQEHLHAAAEAIRAADTLIEQLAEQPDGSEREELLALVRSERAQAFAVMQRLNPDQAWFWKAEWQAGEREVDRNVAAGNLIHFASDEEFNAALDALDAEAVQEAEGTDAG